MTESQIASLPEYKNSTCLFLAPGKMVFCENPTLVSTVLGSCVSVTMFWPKGKIGAICHGLLPVNASGEKDDCGRYVDCSIAKMLQDFENIGVTKNKLQVKVFGGSRILSTHEESSVGFRNSQTASKVLGDFGIVPMVLDTGGVVGRKILFHTSTGVVWMKRVQRLSVPQGA